MKLVSIKIAEAKGPALNWLTLTRLNPDVSNESLVNTARIGWTAAGQKELLSDLLTSFRVAVIPVHTGRWHAYSHPMSSGQYGDTPLEAVQRALCQQYGSQIHYVPEELLK